MSDSGNIVPDDATTQLLHGSMSLTRVELDWSDDLLTAEAVLRPR